MYTTTSIRFQAARQLQWYQATDVLAYMHQLKDFILQGGGKLSSVYLPTLEHCDTFKLFDPLVRFPESTYLICEGIGDWNLRLQRLQLLSSIITNSHRIKREYCDIPTLGDAELSLLGGIHDAIRAFESTEDLVDRVDFENRYNLTWEPNQNDYHQQAQQEQQEEQEEQEEREQEQYD